LKRGTVKAVPPTQHESVLYRGSSIKEGTRMEWGGEIRVKREKKC